MVRSANFITIQDLTPNKTYYIRVLAFTSVGDGPLSQDLQIIAKTGGKIQNNERIKQEFITEIVPICQSLKKCLVFKDAVLYLCSSFPAPGL